MNTQAETDPMTMTTNPLLDQARAELQGHMTSDPAAPLAAGLSPRIAELHAHLQEARAARAALDPAARQAKQRFQALGGKELQGTAPAFLPPAERERLDQAMAESGLAAVDEQIDAAIEATCDAWSALFQCPAERPADAALKLELLQRDRAYLAEVDPELRQVLEDAARMLGVAGMGARPAAA